MPSGSAYPIGSTLSNSPQISVVWRVLWDIWRPDSVRSGSVLAPSLPPRPDSTRFVVVPTNSTVLGSAVPLHRRTHWSSVSVYPRDLLRVPRSRLPAGPSTARRRRTREQNGPPLADRPAIRTVPAAPAMSPQHRRCRRCRRYRNGAEFGEEGTWSLSWSSWSEDYKCANVQFVYGCGI